MKGYPYGRVPFLIAIVAAAAAIGVMLSSNWRARTRPDLLIATASPEGRDAFLRKLPAFERRHGVRVEIELLAPTALQERMRNTLLAGSDAPDLVELESKTFGYFSAGPLRDIGFVDLTERIAAENIAERVIASRLALWTTRGRTFALPRDMHTVVLAYRRDLVEQLGIDVSHLDTWDRFTAVGRRITLDHDGDGSIDRYALDTSSYPFALPLLLNQREAHPIRPGGGVDFLAPGLADTLVWYAKQTVGPHRIAYEAGWGQPQIKALLDGLVVFVVAPDWRTKLLERQIPSLAGKMALMPLPAWHAGGRRTATAHEATGLFITRSSRRPDLAWELAKHLYLDEHDVPARFDALYVMPPLVAALSSPALDNPRPFYGGQPIGRLFADLVPTVPRVEVIPQLDLVNMKLFEVVQQVLMAVRRGDDGPRLDTVTRESLAAAQRSVDRHLTRAARLVVTE